MYQRVSFVLNCVLMNRVVKGCDCNLLGKLFCKMPGRLLSDIVNFDIESA